MKTVYVIPECNIPQLQDLINKVNKAAVKLGLAESKFTVLDINRTTYLVKTNADMAPFWVSNVEDRHIIISKRDWYNVEVCGSQPKFDGWEFCATLMPLPTDDGMENMIRKVPSCEYNIPAEYRNRVGECDHCGYKRRRNETYVVRKDDGEFRMVGSSCMKDFLGHIDPHAISSYLEHILYIDSLQSVGDESERDIFGKSESYYDVKQVLSITSAVINVRGWLSKKKASEEGGIATANVVEYILLPPYKLSEYEKKLVKEIVISDEDKAKAEDVLQWIKNIDPNVDNEYLYNLSLLSRVTGINYRSLGILCSAVYAYDREMTKKQEVKNNYVNSEFVGKVKDRICLNVTVNKKNRIDSVYGTSIIHHMSDDNGNYLVWFCTSANDLDEGKKYHVKATIKKHDLYNGIKQTLVNRVSVIGE